MQCKEKDVYIFFLQYLRHSDATIWGTVFSLVSKSLYVVGLFTHLNNLIVFVRCIEMVEKVYRNTKMKIIFNMDFNIFMKLTSI